MELTQKLRQAADAGAALLGPSSVPSSALPAGIVSTEPALRDARPNALPSGARLRELVLRDSQAAKLLPSPLLAARDRPALPRRTRRCALLTCRCCAAPVQALLVPSLPARCPPPLAS